MIKLGRVSKVTRGAVLTGLIEDLDTCPPGSRYPLAQCPQAATGHRERLLRSRLDRH